MEVIAYLSHQTNLLIYSLLVEYSPPKLVEILSECTVKLSEVQFQRVIEIQLKYKERYGLLWRMRYALAYAVNQMSIRLGFSSSLCFSFWVEGLQRSPLYECSTLITQYHPEVEPKVNILEKRKGQEHLLSIRCRNSSGDGNAKVINGEQCMNSKPNSFISLEDLSEFINVEECDEHLARLAYSEKNCAVWIIDQATQEVLLANRSALEANCKPPRDVLTKDISILWDEEPLQQLTNLVHKDKRVAAHTNTGYRWQKEKSSNIWTRVRHYFTVDYAEVNFLGQVCRFEIVKEAVPV